MFCSAFLCCWDQAGSDDDSSDEESEFTDDGEDEDDGGDDDSDHKNEDGEHLPVGVSIVGFSLVVMGCLIACLERALNEAGNFSFCPHLLEGC